MTPVLLYSCNPVIRRLYDMYIHCLNIDVLWQAKEIKEQCRKRVYSCLVLTDTGEEDLSKIVYELKNIGTIKTTPIFYIFQGEITERLRSNVFHLNYSIEDREDVIQLIHDIQYNSPFFNIN